MMPTDRPSAQLHAALSSVAVAPLAPKLEHAVEFVADESLNELVIVIDQFEEVWTLTSDVDERDRFVALLRRIAVDDSINVRLVFAIRADFFDRPLSEPELGSIVGRRCVFDRPDDGRRTRGGGARPGECGGGDVRAGARRRDRRRCGESVGEPAVVAIRSGRIVRTSTGSGYPDGSRTASSVASPALSRHGPRLCTDSSTKRDNWKRGGCSAVS